MSKLTHRNLWSLGLKEVNEQASTITFSVSIEKMHDSMLVAAWPLRAEELVAFARKLEEVVRYYDELFVAEELGRQPELPNLQEGLANV